MPNFRHGHNMFKTLRVCKKLCVLWLSAVTDAWLCAHVGLAAWRVVPTCNAHSIETVQFTFPTHIFNI